MGLKRAIIALSSTEVAVMILGLMTGVVVARAVGPAGRGVTTLALMLPMLVAWLFNAGLSEAIVHFVRSSSRGGPTYLSTAAFYTLVAGVAAAIVSIVLGFALGTSLLTGVPVSLILWGGVIAPLESARINGAAFVIARARVGAYNLVNLSNYGLTLLATVLLVPMLHLGVLGVIWAQLIGSGLSAMAACGAAYWTCPEPAKHRPAVSELKQLTGFGFKVVFGALAQKLNYRFDFLIVNLLLGPSAVGIYAIGSRAAEILLIAPRSFRLLWFAKVSESPRGDHSEDTRRVAKKLRRGMLLVSPIFAVVGVVAIRVAFGDQFTDSIPVFLLLLPGVIALCVTMPFTAGVYGAGHALRGSIASWLAAVATLALDFALIPHFGLVGASVASSLAYFMYGVVMWRVWLKLRPLQA